MRLQKDDALLWMPRCEETKLKQSKWIWNPKTGKQKKKKKKRNEVKKKGT
jgi:hypothetical protein